jgi:hypothetical protein
MPRDHLHMAAVIVTPEFVDIENPVIARALLGHIVEHADIVGEDMRGRSVLRFEFAAEPWLLDKLAALGAREADFESDADFEVDDAT